MNAHILDLIPRKVCDFDDKIAQASVTAGSTSSVVSFRTKMGKQAYLVAISTAIDSAGVANVVYSLKQDTAKVWPYANLNVQISDPALWSFLPHPIPLNQNALIELSFVNSGAAAYNCTGRVIIYYAEIDK